MALIEDKTEPRLIQDKTDAYLLEQLEELRAQLDQLDRRRRRNDIWQSVAVICAFVIEGILIFNLYA
jgi:hypothetical protein